ncbi:hypothetical protein CF319_g5046 [Tilletia indica]|nr:hypothetical protein CF319_g5046 [Tilletia indica]
MPRSSKGSWWKLQNQDTGRFPSAVGHTALLLLPRLPAELILRILRLISESQPTYIRFSLRFTGLHLLSPGHQMEMGPVMCDPYWAEEPQREHFRSALPRQGDECMGRDYVRGLRVHEDHILPTVTMPVSAAKAHWTHDRFRNSLDCALDLTGVQA